MYNKYMIAFLLTLPWRIFATCEDIMQYYFRSKKKRDHSTAYVYDPFFTNGGSSILCFTQDNFVISIAYFQFVNVTVDKLHLPTTKKRRKNFFVCDISKKLSLRSIKSTFTLLFANSSAGKINACLKLLLFFIKRIAAR